MTPTSLVESLSQNQKRLAELQTQVNRVFIGKESVVRYALTTLLAGGHLLIEDVPGVGKTTLALALANSTGCDFQRVQFTSDLLPTDLLGISILNAKTNEFEFRRGPIFHQVVLADELNRATPRTQGALLEAMNERQVTIDNQTHPLPVPFFVIGTQNPHEHHGTFPLPESQLDRFMMRLSIGYPTEAHEREVLRIGASLDGVRQLKPVLSVSDLQALIDTAARVQVSPVVDAYVLALVQATRESEKIEVGVSPRGALALRRAAQAHALLADRAYVTPDDVKQLAISVLAHRLIFAADQIADPRAQAERFVEALLQRVSVPL